jgi:hypothetical protein
MKLYNKQLIIKLLTKHEHLRDNDTALIANIWYREFDAEQKTYDFLKAFADGKLTNPESIRRARQKVQEEMPELRGKSYQIRHKEEKNFKEKVINY